MDPGASDTIDMLNAATAEFSGLKKAFKSKITILEKQIKESEKRELRLEVKINTASFLVKDYLKDSSLNDIMKERFRNILTVLETPSTTDKESNLISESTSDELGAMSGIKIESKDISKNTAAEENLDTSVRGSNKRCQKLPSRNFNFPTNKRRRGEITRKKTVIKVGHSTPVQIKVEATAGINFPQTQTNTTSHESDSIVEAKKESRDLVDLKRTTPTQNYGVSVLESSKSLENSHYEVNAVSAMKRRKDSSVNETMDNVTAGKSSDTETVDKCSTQIKGAKESEVSPSSPNNKRHNFRSPGLSTPTQVNLEKDCSDFNDDQPRTICLENVDLLTKLLKTKSVMREVIDAIENINVDNELLERIQKMLNSNEIPLEQLVHIETIWEKTVTNAELMKKHRGFTKLIFEKYDKSGKYREAYDFCCRAINVLNRTLVVDDSRSKLALKRWQGDALQSLGKHSEAMELLMEVYEKQKKSFGEEDNDCLDTANLIGIANYNLNNYDQAMKWYQSTLEKRERINGKEHPVTLDIKNNIGLVLDGQRKYAEAGEIYKEVLEAAERWNGPEYQETLAAVKFNLACLSYKKKSYKDALGMFTNILGEQERVWGLDHPSTLYTRRWIAATNKCVGRNGRGSLN